MGMRKKNSRLITVNEVMYRWKVTEDGDGLKWFVSIQQVTPSGQRLLIRFERQINWHPHPSLQGAQSGEWLPAAITPNVIRQLIEAAQELGWHSARNGLPALWLNGHQIVPDLSNNA